MTLHYNNDKYYNILLEWLSKQKKEFTRKQLFNDLNIKEESTMAGMFYRLISGFIKEGRVENAGHGKYIIKKAIHQNDL